MVCATIFKLRRYPFISSTAPRPIYHPQQRPLSAAPIFPIPSPAPTWIFIDIFNKKLTKCLKYIAFYNFVDELLIYNANYNKKNKKKRGLPLSKIIYNLFTLVVQYYLFQPSQRFIQSGSRPLSKSRQTKPVLPSQ